MTDSWVTEWCIILQLATIKLMWIFPIAFCETIVEVIFTIVETKHCTLFNDWDVQVRL